MITDPDSSAAKSKSLDSSLDLFQAPAVREANYIRGFQVSETVMMHNRVNLLGMEFDSS